MYIPSFIHKTFKPVVFCAVRLKISIGHLEYTEFRSNQNFYSILEMIFLSHLLSCESDSQWCYLPAVGIYPNNIRKRNQHTHWRHASSQMVPVHVHIDEHAYKRAEGTYNHYYHVHGINSRYFLHMNWNSRHFEEENHRTETTFRQSLWFWFFSIHVK